MHYELCFPLIIHNTKAPAEAAALQALAHSAGAVGRIGRAIHSNMTSLTYLGRSKTAALVHVGAVLRLCDDDDNDSKLTGFVKMFPGSRPV